MVLVIVGLMSSAVVMTLPKDPAASRTLSETLIKRLNKTAQESLLAAKPAAFGASKTAYALYDYDGIDWNVKTEKAWPDAVTISLHKDGEEVKLSETLTPLIVFEPTGSSSVFTLTLSDFDGRYVLSSIGDGRVVMESGR